MKMVMISYNSAIESEVTEVLEKSGIENYTKWIRVQGRGNASGPHFGSEVWPGENSVIFSATEDEKLENLLRYIKELRTRLRKEGIKAFVWGLEEMT